MWLTLPYPFRLVVLLGVLLFVLSPTVHAAPQVPQGACPFFAEMSTGIRAMALEKVDPRSTRTVIGYWYPQTLTIPLAGEITDALVVAAYRDTREPEAFARAFYEACLRGRLDGFLGVGA